MRRGLFWTVLIAAFGTLAASYGGAAHPLGDSLAVFRLHIGLVCLALSLIALSLHLRIGAAALLLSGLALGPVLWAMLFAPPGAPGLVTVYQKNMLFQPRDLSPLIADIRAARPDVLTLQEVTQRNTAMLAALAADMPAQLICPFARVGAVAVASRWPLIAGSEICREREGLAAIRVTGPDGPVWLVSLHLHWPWPHGQAPQRDRLLPVLEALEGPVIIGGDFNMVPWSHTMRRIARATGTSRLGRAYNSMTRFALVPLPIDHVLAPAGATGTTKLHPLLGSDHHGIVAQITF